MSQRVYYSIGSIDGESISFRKEEISSITPAFTFKFRYIGIVIALSIIFLFVGKYYNISKRAVNPQSINSSNEYTFTMQKSMDSYNKTHINTDGFVFGYSSTKAINREEVMALQNVKGTTFQRLLRMSINEIYAKKGQIFQARDINDNYYQQFEWYHRTHKHIVEWDEFNEWEKQNLELLISIEKEYGYR